ncbi:MAG TPA: oligosaccharide flippase family protein [Thermomicrobiales bacterium]|nr:oligosaccharide flippase family protein [Thermomicrobiales bacterium]
MLRTLLRQSSSLLVATLISNLCAYALNLYTARALGPIEYGTLGALIALLYLFVIPAGALQTSVARFGGLARAAGDRARLGGLLRRVTAALLCLAAASIVLVIASSPPLARAMHVGSVRPIYALAALLWLTFLLSTNRGALQGWQSIGQLSINLSIEAGLRLAFGAAFVFVGFGVTGVLSGYCVAALLSLAASWLVLPAFRRHRDTPPLVEILHFSGPALAAYMAMAWMTNVDILVVNHFLAGRVSGQYVSLATLAKLLFFISNALTDTMFALSVAADTRRASRRLLYQTIAIDTALCLPAVAGAALFARPVVSLLFGPAYAVAAGQLWRFLLASYLFTLIIVYTKDGLARNAMAFLPILLGGAALESILLAAFHGSIGQVLTVLIASFLLTLAGLVALDLARQRRWGASSSALQRGDANVLERPLRFSVENGAGTADVANHWPPIEDAKERYPPS